MANWAPVPLVLICNGAFLVMDPVGKAHIRRHDCESETGQGQQSLSKLRKDTSVFHILVIGMVFFFFNKKKSTEKSSANGTPLR